MNEMELVPSRGLKQVIGITKATVTNPSPAHLLIWISIVVFFWFASGHIVQAVDKAGYYYFIFFNNASSLALGMAMSIGCSVCHEVSLSIFHFGSDWKISTANRWFAMKLCIDIQGPQMMRPNHFDDLL